MSHHMTPAGENIGFCSNCGRIVLLFPVGDGTTWVADPDHFQRRWVRSLLGPAEVVRRGYGSNPGGSHHCGPVPAEPPSRVEALERGEQLLN